MAESRRWWHDAWAGDRDASDLAMRSEHRLARSRFAVVLMFTVYGVAVALREPRGTTYWGAIPVNLTCLALATVVLVITRRGQRPTWLATATALGDVTMVSLLHLLELLQGTPSAALNGRITFTAYFFALLGTCVRWDRRIAVAAGAMAAAQYGLIVLAGARSWPATVTPDIVRYGTFDAGVQVERILTLLLFGAACASIAHWATKLKGFATTDQLTRLMNRRSFEERMRDELLMAWRRRSDLGVVMIDIDHFKQVNDMHGHHAGDHVLRQVATMLRTSVRRTDLVSRWGGEEFVIAFLDASLVQASHEAESLRKVVEGTPVTLSNGEVVRITLSIGVAAASGEGFDFDTLVRAADQHLLSAKREGRNRVVTAGMPAAV
ncbi:MAG: GGDEF domain-containing protein [Gemmatimonadaceae bacterium]|nr:GGDEF domain-containing protein [Gemmatimonadaceae bacterium]